MGSDPAHHALRLWPLYLACYALWLGLSALGGWMIFAVRPLLFALAVQLRLNPWQVRAIEKKRDQLAARHSKARSVAERKAEQARDDYEAELAQWEA